MYPHDIRGVPPSFQCGQENELLLVLALTVAYKETVDLLTNKNELASFPSGNP
jgi:hypothetical protein